MALANGYAIQAGDTLSFDSMSTGLKVAVTVGIDNNSNYLFFNSTGDGT